MTQNNEEPRRAMTDETTARLAARGGRIAAIREGLGNLEANDFRIKHNWSDGMATLRNNITIDSANAETITLFVMAVEYERYMLGVIDDLTATLAARDAEIAALRGDGWIDNASLYTYSENNDAFGAALSVSYNPFERRWNWTTTTRINGSDHASFHDFGTLDTVQEAKDAAKSALKRWKGLNAAEPNDGA